MGAVSDAAIQKFGIMQFEYGLTGHWPRNTEAWLDVKRLFEISYDIQFPLLDEWASIYTSNNLPPELPKQLADNTGHAIMNFLENGPTYGASEAFLRLELKPAAVILKGLI